MELAAARRDTTHGAGAGAGGVRTDASAIIANATVTGATSDSFVTVYPAGASVPNASNLNFTAGQTAANLVAVKVGTGGQVALNNSAGSTNAILDVVGYFATT